MKKKPQPKQNPPSPAPMLEMRDTAAEDPIANARREGYRQAEKEMEHKERRASSITQVTDAATRFLHVMSLITESL